jgi:hypothetical protein
VEGMAQREISSLSGILGLFLVCYFLDERKKDLIFVPCFKSPVFGKHNSVKMILSRRSIFLP